MVRLEKIAYEKLVNSGLLGRAREITKAKKIYSRDYDGANFLSFDNLIAPFFPFLVPLYDKISSFAYRFGRNNMVVKGLSWEDTTMYSDVELRRSPLMEHIWRESFHPYEKLLYSYRRQRFFKVNFGFDGFEVPDSIQKEAREHIWLYSIERKMTIDNFIHNHYISDLTPNTYQYVGKILLLEWFMFYNLISYNAWNRLFYNEKDYLNIDNYVKDTMLDKETRLYNNKEDFEEEIKTINDNYPGVVAVEGEEIKMDLAWEKFKNYYEIKYLNNNSNIDILKKEFNDNDNYNSENLLLSKGEEVSGKNNIGTKLPKRIFKKSEKALMN